MTRRSVSLGQLLLALDATMVTLVDSPRGLDLQVASAALVDPDDVRLGLARGAVSADVFLLLGLADDEVLTWLARQGAQRVPAAIFVKEPSDAVIARAGGLGSAVVAVEPLARWERLYRLVDHVFDHLSADPALDSGTDLFGLAQSIADRTRGMISIEDAQSHVLAYSASNDEADELRRLSILGRAGPAEHLAWIDTWGIFDAVRAGEVVRVAARPELGLRPRRAVGIVTAADQPHRPPTFAGTIWLQEGSRPLADDTDDVLRGAAVLAARVLTRLATTPSAHAVLLAELLGLRTGDRDVDALARDLGILSHGRPTVVGFDGPRPASVRLSDVLALSASAFRPDAQVTAQGTADGDRVYVLLPDTGRASVPSWLRGTVGALRSELNVELRAVFAAPVDGLDGVAAARAEVDRVLDSARRHPGTLGAVTSLAEARTTVVLDEIVTLIAADERLIDPRIRALRAADPVLAETLRAHLDAFGDVAAAARRLHVHPNTVRYRIRRIEDVVGTTLADPDVRLLLSLSLRALD